MSTATAEAVQTKFEILPLAHITPSPMNPRKRFDEKALKELAESIKAHGVQQPIVVRPDGNKRDRYEIVVGERRFKASKLAGKTEIPALINSLSNSAALEIMVIENLQREDVHPFDEALGYEALLKKVPEGASDKHTAESIADKVGKSVGYIYARLKLLALIPSAREAFEKNEVTAGHAVLIARLQPADQEKALKACFTDPHSYGNPREKGPLIAEKQLRKWIADNVQLDLDKAPFDIADAELLPSAGACTECPKRSGTNPALFEGMNLGKDTCLDPACFQAKKMALVNISVDKVEEKHGERPILLSHHYRPEDGKREKGVVYEEGYRDKFWREGKEQSIKAESCPHTKLGVFVDDEPYGLDKGKGAGQKRYVCTAGAGKCKEHMDGTSTHSSADDGAAIRRKRKTYGEYSNALFKAIAGALKKPTRADMELIASQFFQKLGHYQETPLIRLLEWDKKLGAYNGNKAREQHFSKMSDAELSRSMVLMAIASDLVVPGEYSGGSWTPHLLELVAKRHGVKAEPLQTAAKEKFAKKKKLAAKPAKPAKAKAKKAKAGK